MLLKVLQKIRQLKLHNFFVGIAMSVSSCFGFNLANDMLPTGGFDDPNQVLLAASNTRRQSQILKDSRAIRNPIGAVQEAAVVQITINLVGEEEKEIELFDIRNRSPIEKKRKKPGIFVDALQTINLFPSYPANRDQLKNYDSFEKRFVDRDKLLKAHYNSIEYVRKDLPRQIDKKDKSVKIDSGYKALFLKNYKDLFELKPKLASDYGVSREISSTQIKAAEKKMFRKYKKKSQNYLREVLFENAYSLKIEKCRDFECRNFVTIYYNFFDDYFAIVDSQTNTLINLGKGSYLIYAELFLNQSFKVINPNLLSTSVAERITEREQSPKQQKEEQKEKPIVRSDVRAREILAEKYSGFISFIDQNDEFKIKEIQSAKKVKHLINFGTKVEDYNFTQALAEKISQPGGIVLYTQRDYELPSLDLVRVYQNIVKTFCTDPLTMRKDSCTFRGQPSIIFYNEDRRLVAIFEKETKMFISAYKVSRNEFEEFLKTHTLGKTEQNNNYNDLHEEL